MKNVFYILVLLFIFGCTSKKETKVIITQSKTPKQSEMAALMLKMYAFNLENKKLILEGNSPIDFPKEFLEIHTAKLTDSSNRNAVFNAFSSVYLKNLEQVFNAPKDSLITKHNITVNSCITCHQTTCVGPIPKIKKLLIQ